MSCSILFPLSGPFYRDTSFNYLSEENQDVGGEPLSTLHKKNNSTLLSLLPSSFTFEAEKGLTVSMESLHTIEACICSSEADFREIKQDSCGRTLLHQLVLTLDEPVGRYYKGRKKIRDLELMDINQISSSYINQVTGLPTPRLSEKLINKIIKNYRYLIKKDLRKQVKSIKDASSEYRNLNSEELKSSAKNMINIFYNSIKIQVSNFNIVHFNKNNIIYRGPIIFPKTGPEKAVKEISEYLADRELAADLYNFAKELTIFDKIILGLIVRGVNINASTTTTKETALHLAVQQQNCFLLVLALLKHGANPNLLDKSSETALHLVIQAEDALSILPILLEYGANPNVPNKFFETALHLAVKTKHALSIVPMLLEYGAKIDIRDQHLETALHRAVNNKNAASILTLLLNAGADPDAPNERQETALHLALKTENAFSTVLTLLDYGADSNASNEHLETALHLATQSKNASLIAPILLQYGADPTLCNKDGQTAIDIAHNNGDYDLVNLLKLGRPSKKPLTTKLTPPTNGRIHLGTAAAVQGTDAILVKQGKRMPSEPARSAVETLQQTLSSPPISQQSDFSRFIQPINGFLKTALKVRLELTNIA